MTIKADSPDEYAVLAAIWILASNDETSLITYRGVQHRLNLPADYDVQDLVRRHGELFRLGMPASRLEQWKNAMRDGNRLPSWIREAADQERTQLIDAISSSDGFRSQFRAELAAPKSEMAVIDWGLSHIERLRKAHTEAREATAKSWHMWLVFAIGVLGVAATIIVALVHPKLHGFCQFLPPLHFSFG